MLLALFPLIRLSGTFSRREKEQQRLPRAGQKTREMHLSQPLLSIQHRLDPLEVSFERRQMIVVFAQHQRHQIQ